MTIEEKLKRLNEELSILFPGLYTAQYRYGNEIEMFKYLHLTIASENANLTESPYFYNKQKLIHYTNVDALKSILENKNIRLYNLNNLNDPTEFKFASQIFNLPNEAVKDAQDNIYSISFCEEDLLGNEISNFNMWRLYGRNGNGISIVFKVVNTPTEWKDFHISEISYGVKYKEAFIQLVKLIDDFNQSERTVSIDLSKLIIFHKSELFKLEEEVRIICDRRELRVGLINNTISRDGQPIFPIIKRDIEKSDEHGKQISYLELPIFYENQGQFNVEIPLLKIEKIIIGYNHDKQKVQELIKMFEELCKVQLGYKPVILQTELADIYWGNNKLE